MSSVIRQRTSEIDKYMGEVGHQGIAYFRIRLKSTLPANLKGRPVVELPAPVISCCHYILGAIITCVRSNQVSYQLLR